MANDPVPIPRGGHEQRREKEGSNGSKRACQPEPPQDKKDPTSPINSDLNHEPQHEFPHCTTPPHPHPESSMSTCNLTFRGGRRTRGGGKPYAYPNNAHTPQGPT
ncbi:hypothetical protein AMECASPLE_003265 [Ameca splendens]|uniref:Uncharacterized protein n=1 Tax=Ameca splendens TaxID=208324 RepID=A0ABV0XMP2_9TELE